MKGFTVNQHYTVFIQICDKILLSQENYADTANVVVNFINYNNGLQTSLKKDAFLLIFKDIFDINKMAEN